MNALALISACPMGSSNGIGAQFVQLVEGSGAPYRHFWWESWDRRPSDSPHSILLPRHILPETARALWPFPRGGDRLAQMLPAVNLPGACWRGTQLRQDRFDQLRDGIDLDFDVALVAPIREEEALHTLALLDALQCPYVFQVWDIMHEEGIDPGNMPGYRSLVEGAGEVVCLTESLAGEVAKLRDEPTELISFGREVRAEAGARWQDGEFRIALLGFLDYYPDGLALMAEAWPRITKAVPHGKLVYIGKKDQLPFLPPVLREALEFHEFPSNDERDDILASCQLAFLPGPLRSTTSLGRFSVPCRIADYLHLGLPILGSVGAGGATAQFLQSIEGRAFYRAEDALTLASHVTLIAERGAWEKASATSRQFAQERLNMNTIRPRLLEIIENVRNVT